VPDITTTGNVPPAGVWTPVTVNSGASDLQPAWSPSTATPFATPTGPLARQLIAFTSNRDGDNDIWISAEDGGSPDPGIPTGAVDVTHNAADDQHADWSPDGRFLAFDSNVSGSRQIYVIDVQDALDGQATASQLTQGEGASEPSWMTYGDGDSSEMPPQIVATSQRLAFVGQHDGASFVDTLEQVFPATTPPVPAITAGPLTVEPLTGDPGGAGAPTWTATGYDLLYDSGPPGNRDLYALDLANSAATGPQRLTEAPGDDIHPEDRAGTWSCAGMNPSPPRPRPVIRTPPPSPPPTQVTSTGQPGSSRTPRATRGHLSIRRMRVTVRGRGSRRSLAIEVTVTSGANATLRLTRGRRTIVRRAVRLRAGANRLTLNVPRGVRRGRYQLRVRITAESRTRLANRSVRLPG
jgi:dipeptidyl aminopeptidase/acylaminoacyl peptidase